MKKIWCQWYDNGVSTSIDYPNTAVKDLFNGQVDHDPDRRYLIYDERCLTYGAFNTYARKLANGLINSGVNKGDRVALLASNIPEWVIVRQACHKIGAIAVPINPLSSLREMSHFFMDSGAETIFVMAEFADKPIEILHSQTTFIKRILVLQTPNSAVDVEHTEKVVDFYDFISGESAQEPAVKVNSDDIAVLQYTGGTTGVSKACALTNRNLVVKAFQTAEWLKPLISGREMKTLAALPLYHVYGFNMNINVNMITGGSAVLVNQPTSDNLLQAINAHEPNFFAAVPTMLLGLNQHLDTPKSKIKSIRVVYSGGSPLAIKVMETFEKISGARITEGYGLSEVTNVLTFNPIQSKRKIGSIGIPWPDVDLRIVDMETGMRELPHGEPGELIARTPALMKGYWNNPEQTRQAIRDGWLYTGDIAKMDEDGFIFIVDRMKDMILVSGFNVYPREIDEVMFTHPKVLSACSVGVPDEKRGETVKVFIVKKLGESLTEQEVINYCKDQLAPYKVPRMVEFIDQLPLTAVGKPDRKELRSRKSS